MCYTIKAREPFVFRRRFMMKSILKRTKRCGLLVMAAAIGFLLAQCGMGAEDAAVSTPDYRTVLTADGTITVPAADMAAAVFFTGAAGLSLNEEDFAVTDGGAIDRVSVADDVVTIIVTFKKNESLAAKIYNVVIASTSQIVGGDASVKIIHLGTSGSQYSCVALAAGSVVAVLATETTAVVTWTGEELAATLAAAGFTLAATDFTVTGDGVTVNGVSVAGDTATVTVGFPLNETTAAKTYTVSVAEDSEIVTGNGNVTITQAGKVESEQLSLLTWTAVTDSKFGNTIINAITYGGGRFVAGGDDGKIAHSADGETWTATAVNTFNTNGYNQYVLCVTYGNGTLVAGGSGGQLAYSENAGVTWEKADSTLLLGYVFHGITYGNSMFVAGGSDGKMVHSPDGKSWTQVTDSTFSYSDTITGVIYANGMFVAVGAGSTRSGGRIAYSADGKNWTKVNSMSLGFEGIWDVTYGNGRFVAVGDHGKTSHSTDGINWTVATSSPFGTFAIEAITYGGGRFVAVGGSINGKMAYSADGITWTAVEDSTFGSSGINAVTYGNGRFVAVGYDGKMAYSNIVE
jgi:hypothetical protein